MRKGKGDASRVLRKALIGLCRGAAVALAVFLVLPTRALEERQVKSRIAPLYPEIAKRLKVGGTVVVRATVDPEGKVSDVKTLSGNRMLSTAAEDAVRKWRFTPAAASSTVDVEVNFGSGQ